MTGSLGRIERWIALHPVGFAAGVTALVITAALALEMRFETSDDVAMMWIADGTTYGTRQATLVFSSALVGGVLAWLYGVAAAVPWYGLYLVAAVAIASGIVAYLVASDQRTPLAPRLAILGGLTGAFLLPRMVALQFTTASILLGGAGALLHLGRAHRLRTGMVAAVVGGAALGVAALIRLRGAQGVVVLLLPLLAAGVGRIRWRRQAAFAAVAAAIALAGLVADAAAYDDAWDDWRAFNRVRGRLHSTRIPAEARHHPILAEIGWTTTDLRMFEEWFFTDEKVYDTAALGAIATVDVPASPAPLRAQVTGLLPVSRLALLVAALVAALALSTRAGGLRLVAAVGWMALVTGWLAVYQRLPDRVAVPILALAAVVLLTRPGAPAGSRPRHRWALVGPAAVALVVGLIGIAQLVGDRPHRTGSQARLESIYRQLDAIDENGVFLALGGSLGTQMVSPMGAPALRPPPDIIPLGWQTQSPPHDRLLERHGIEDAYLAVAHDPSVHLVASRAFDPDLFVRYLERHYRLSGELRRSGSVAGGAIVAYDLLVAAD